MKKTIFIFLCVIITLFFAPHQYTIKDSYKENNIYSAEEYSLPIPYIDDGMEDNF